MSYNRKVRSSGAYARARKIILARDDFCYLCGGYIDKTLPRYNDLAPEVDHIVAIANGGSATDLDNMALSHRYCNNLKSNKDLYKIDKMSLRKQVEYLKSEFTSSGTDWLG